MTDKQLLATINDVAQSYISNSALRNQYKQGLLPKIRNYFLYNFDLKEFVGSYNNPKTMEDFYERHSQELMKPPYNLKWGTTRKAIDVFVKGVVNQSQLANHYGISHELDTSLQYVNCILDSHVAKVLKKINPKLPKFNSIVSLTPQVYFSYQEQAMTEAKKENSSRVHMDRYWWRSNQ